MMGDCRFCLAQRDSAIGRMMTEAQWVAAHLQICSNFEIAGRLLLAR